MGFTDKMNNKAREMRGRMKRNAGEVTNNPRLSGEDYVRKLWSLGIQASLAEDIGSGDLTA